MAYAADGSPIIEAGGQLREGVLLAAGDGGNVVVGRIRRKNHTSRSLNRSNLPSAGFSGLASPAAAGDTNISSTASQSQDRAHIAPRGLFSRLTTVSEGHRESLAPESTSNDSLDRRRRGSHNSLNRRMSTGLGSAIGLLDTNSASMRGSVTGEPSTDPLVAIGQNATLDGKPSPQYSPNAHDSQQMRRSSVMSERRASSGARRLSIIGRSFSRASLAGGNAAHYRDVALHSSSGSETMEPIRAVGTSHAADLCCLRLRSRQIDEQFSRATHRASARSGWIVIAALGVCLLAVELLAALVGATWSQTDDLAHRIAAGGLMPGKFGDSVFVAIVYLLETLMFAWCPRRRSCRRAGMMMLCHWPIHAPSWHVVAPYLIGLVTLINPTILVMRQAVRTPTGDTDLILFSWLTPLVAVGTFMGVALRSRPGEFLLGFGPSAIAAVVFTLVYSAWAVNGRSSVWPFLQHLFGPTILFGILAVFFATGFVWMRTGVALKLFLTSRLLKRENRRVNLVLEAPFQGALNALRRRFAIETTQRHEWLLFPDELRVGRAIGRGTDATVYAGSVYGWPCVIKRHHGTCKTPEDLVSFVKGMNLLTQLNSANVVRVLGASFVGKPEAVELQGKTRRRRFEELLGAGRSSQSLLPSGGYAPVLDMVGLADDADGRRGAFGQLLHWKRPADPAAQSSNGANPAASGIHDGGDAGRTVLRGSRGTGGFPERSSGSESGSSGHHQGHRQRLGAVGRGGRGRHRRRSSLPGTHHAGTRRSRSGFPGMMPGSVLDALRQSAPHIRTSVLEKALLDRPIVIVMDWLSLGTLADIMDASETMVPVPRPLAQQVPPSPMARRIQTGPSFEAHSSAVKLGSSAKYQPHTLPRPQGVEGGSFGETTAGSVADTKSSAQSRRLLGHHVANYASLDSEAPAVSTSGNCKQWGQSPKMGGMIGGPVDALSSPHGPALASHRAGGKRCSVDVATGLVSVDVGTERGPELPGGPGSAVAQRTDAPAAGSDAEPMERSGQKRLSSVSENAGAAASLVGRSLQREAFHSGDAVETAADDRVVILPASSKVVVKTDAKLHEPSSVKTPARSVLRRPKGWRGSSGTPVTAPRGWEMPESAGPSLAVGAPGLGAVGSAGVTVGGGGVASDGGSSLLVRHIDATAVMAIEGQGDATSAPGHTDAPPVGARTGKTGTDPVAAQLPGTPIPQARIRAGSGGIGRTTSNTSLAADPELMAVRAAVSAMAPDLVMQTAGADTTTRLLRMPWGVRIRILCQVAAGCKHLHSFEPAVVHGDLRPSNINLHGDPRRPLACVGDLAIKGFTNEQDWQQVVEAATKGEQTGSILRAVSRRILSGISKAKRGSNASVASRRLPQRHQPAAGPGSRLHRSRSVGTRSNARHSARRSSSHKHLDDGAASAIPADPALDLAPASSGGGSSVRHLVFAEASAAGRGGRIQPSVVGATDPVSRQMVGSRAGSSRQINTTGTSFGTDGPSGPNSSLDSPFTDHRALPHAAQAASITNAAVGLQALTAGLPARPNMGAPSGLETHPLSRALAGREQPESKSSFQAAGNALTAPGGEHSTAVIRGLPEEIPPGHARPVHDDTMRASRRTDARANAANSPLQAGIGVAGWPLTTRRKGLAGFASPSQLATTRPLQQAAKPTKGKSSSIADFRLHKKDGKPEWGAKARRQQQSPNPGRSGAIRGVAASGTPGGHGRGRSQHQASTRRNSSKQQQAAAEAAAASGVGHRGRNGTATTTSSHGRTRSPNSESASALAARAALASRPSSGLQWKPPSSPPGVAPRAVTAALSRDDASVLGESVFEAEASAGLDNVSELPKPRGGWNGSAFQSGVGRVSQADVPTGDELPPDSAMSVGPGAGAGAGGSAVRGAAMFMQAAKGRTIADAVRHERGPQEFDRMTYVTQPAYVAPELFEVGAMPTPASDVFSFAMVAYEVITGRKPYDSMFDDRVAVMIAVEEQRPQLGSARADILAARTYVGASDVVSLLTPAELVVIELREQLEHIVQACWAQNPSARPSFARVCEALAEVAKMYSESVLRDQEELESAMAGGGPVSWLDITKLGPAVDVAGFGTAVWPMGGASPPVLGPDGANETVGDLLVGLGVQPGVSRPATVAELQQVGDASTMGLSAPASRLPMEFVTLEKEIGRGAFGRVYRGALHGTPVAIKTFDFSSKAETNKKVFQREATILGMVRHPCVLSFVGVVVDARLTAIVTEFCGGGSLHSVVMQSRRLADRRMRQLRQLQKAKLSTSGDASVTSSVSSAAGITGAAGTPAAVTFQHVLAPMPAASPGGPEALAATVLPSPLVTDAGGSHSPSHPSKGSEMPAIGRFGGPVTRQASAGKLLAAPTAPHSPTGMEASSRSQNEREQVETRLITQSISKRALIPATWSVLQSQPRSGQAAPLVTSASASGFQSGSAEAAAPMTAFAKGTRTKSQETERSSELLAAGPGLPVASLRRRVHWLLSVTRGLKYLHSISAGICIIHRDIKADNVLLTSSYEAKLADLGFARVTSRSMSRCGTLAFTAPEVLTGVGYDERADIYSFGVVVCEVLSGKKPYFDWSPEIQGKGAGAGGGAASAGGPRTRSRAGRGNKQLMDGIIGGKFRPNFSFEPGLDAPVPGEFEAVTLPDGRLPLPGELSKYHATQTPGQARGSPSPRWRLCALAALARCCWATAPKRRPALERLSVALEQLGSRSPVGYNALASAVEWTLRQLVMDDVESDRVRRAARQKGEDHVDATAGITRFDPIGGAAPPGLRGTRAGSKEGGAEARATAFGEAGLNDSLGKHSDPRDQTTPQDASPLWIARRLAAHSYPFSALPGTNPFAGSAAPHLALARGEADGGIAAASLSHALGASEGVSMIGGSSVDSLNYVARHSIPGQSRAEAASQMDTTPHGSTGWDVTAISAAHRSGSSSGISKPDLLVVHGRSKTSPAWALRNALAVAQAGSIGGGNESPSHRVNGVADGLAGIAGSPGTGKQRAVSYMNVRQLLMHDASRPAAPALQPPSTQPSEVSVGRSGDGILIPSSSDGEASNASWGAGSPKKGPEPGTSQEANASRVHIQQHAADRAERTAVGRQGGRVGEVDAPEVALSTFGEFSQGFSQGGDGRRGGHTVAASGGAAATVAGSSVAVRTMPGRAASARAHGSVAARPNSKRVSNSPSGTVHGAVASPVAVADVPPVAEQAERDASQASATAAPTQRPDDAGAGDSSSPLALTPGGVGSLPTLRFGPKSIDELSSYPGQHKSAAGKRISVNGDKLRNCLLDPSPSMLFPGEWLAFVQLTSSLLTSLLSQVPHTLTGDPFAASTRPASTSTGTANPSARLFSAATLRIFVILHGVEVADARSQFQRWAEGSKRKGRRLSSFLFVPASAMCAPADSHMSHFDTPGVAATAPGVDQVRLGSGPGSTAAASPSPIVAASQRPGSAAAVSGGAGSDPPRMQLGGIGPTAPGLEEAGVGASSETSSDNSSSVVDRTAPPGSHAGSTTRGEAAASGGGSGHQPASSPQLLQQQHEPKACEMLLVSADAMVCGRAVAAWVLQTAQVCNWHSSVPLLSFMYLSRIVRETKLRVFPNPVNWRRMLLACMALAQSCIDRKVVRAVLSKRSPKRMALGLALGAGVDDDESVFKRSPNSLVGLAPQQQRRLAAGMKTGATAAAGVSSVSVARSRQGTAPKAAGPARGLRGGTTAISGPNVAVSAKGTGLPAPSLVSKEAAATAETAAVAIRNTGPTEQAPMQPTEDLPALEEEEEEEEETEARARRCSEASKPGQNVARASSRYATDKVISRIEMSTAVDATSLAEKSLGGQSGREGMAYARPSGDSARVSSEISDLSSQASQEEDDADTGAPNPSLGCDVAAGDPGLVVSPAGEISLASSGAVPETESDASGSGGILRPSSDNSGANGQSPALAAAPKSATLSTRPDLEAGNSRGNSDAMAPAEQPARRPVYPRNNAGASAEGVLLADLLKQVALLLKFRVAVSMKLLARFRGEFRGMMERNEQELTAAMLPAATTTPRRRRDSQTSDAGVLPPGQVAADSSDEDEDAHMDLPRLAPAAVKRVQISEFGAVQQKLILDGTTRSQVSLLKRKQREMLARREHRRAGGVEAQIQADQSAAAASSADGAGLSDTSFSRFSASTLASSAWLPILESSFAEQSSESTSVQ